MIADGKLPKGVVVEELKNYFGEFSVFVNVSKNEHMICLNCNILHYLMNDSSHTCTSIHLYLGEKDLKDKCPKKVRALLEEKDLFDVYDKFVQTIVDTKNTRGATGKWRDAEFEAVLDQFRDEFAEKEVRICFCKSTVAADGSYRWLEFVDVNALEKPYVSQFDVSNYGGQVIKTAYRHIQFPNGVAAEGLAQFGGRKKLKDKIPIEVENLLKKKDLMSEYEKLVDALVEGGRGDNRRKWSNVSCRKIVGEHKAAFSAKGVDIFFSWKNEYVNKAVLHFRWIEFVDKVEQPNYQSQYDSTNKVRTGDGCSIM